MLLTSFSTLCHADAAVTISGEAAIFRPHTTQTSL